MSDNSSYADPRHGIKQFLVTSKQYFGKLVGVNLIMILGNLPILFIVATLFGVTKAESHLPMTEVFGNLAFLYSEGNPDAHSMALFAISGIHYPVMVPTVLTYLFYGIGALTMFTFGCVNAGTTYVLRNIARGEPVSVWSDFIRAVKNNWKQALPFGVVDFLIISITVLNLAAGVNRGLGGFADAFVFWLSVILCVLFLLMRPYIYLQMVSFDLNIAKILKNSCIFLIVGFKRNAVALLGILVVLAVEAFLVLAFRGFLISLAVAAPLLILFAALSYMTVFAAYFKINEVMGD